MKYYSETLRKAFDSEKECLEAEESFQKAQAAEQAKKEALANTRKARAKEVEDAYKAVLDAQKVYNDLRIKFIQDYGSYHMTISSKNDLFDNIWESFIRIF